MDDHGAWILAIIFWGLGFHRLVSGVRGLLQSHRAQRWPWAKGEVISVDVVSVPSWNEDGWIEPRVKYRFEVGGTIYVGGRVAWDGRGGSTPKEARAAARPYRTGDSVRVYFDPADPRKSMLLPNATSGQWVEVGLGLLLVAGGWFPIYVGDG